MDKFETEASQLTLFSNIENQRWMSAVFSSWHRSRRSSAWSMRSCTSITRAPANRSRDTFADSVQSMLSSVFAVRTRLMAPTREGMMLWTIAIVPAVIAEAM